MLGMIENFFAPTEVFVLRTFFLFESLQLRQRELWLPSQTLQRKVKERACSASAPATQQCPSLSATLDWKRMHQAPFLGHAREPWARGSVRPTSVSVPPEEARTIIPVPGCNQQRRHDGSSGACSKMCGSRRKRLRMNFESLKC